MVAKRMGSCRMEERLRNMDIVRRSGDAHDVSKRFVLLCCIREHLLLVAAGCEGLPRAEACVRWLTALMEASRG